MVKRWMTISGIILAAGLAATGCSSPEIEATNDTTTTVTSSSPAETTAPGSSEPSTTATSQTTVGKPASSTNVDTADAMTVLGFLEVKGRAPKTGYDRLNFGPAWADTDHNGCDTRNDILARDLESETFRPGTNDCVVLTGVLHEPYTATVINFVRGQDTSGAVQIDHVVALSDAWQKGAQQLDDAERLAFANDPLNLLAVDGPANMQKSDGDAATWLPANRAFRCEYVARQIGVKAAYGLWVTAAEKDAMVRVLEACPGQEVPVGDAAGTEGVDKESWSLAPVLPAAVEPSAPVVVPEPAVVPAPEGEGLDPRFSSCKKAKAAGLGPYVAGVDPEYHWYGDGDNDGINCE
ncbi:GmrSD restriction endonuclease domain-containing protein [Corynebacterium crudilactis]|uniref:Deoxyribonuclease n=1 Tax=Corynebacterium crudilactis TaxID=1652495 RepID=A0A172QT47_9CORY|nr:DUF1524 domain-containing protein [Corynebacterium crudilactis]ANE03875.1 deoxyribonuclease [Corynebacterium crudilactis]